MPGDIISSFDGKESGWDRYDLRHDYGILAGAGLAVVFKPFEIQIEGNYKYSLLQHLSHKQIQRRILDAVLSA